MLARGISKPVIVVTQHTHFSEGHLSISSIEELDSKLYRYFPTIYRGAVLVDLANDTWHERLLQKAKEAFREF